MYEDSCRAFPVRYKALHSNKQLYFSLRDTEVTQFVDLKLHALMGVLSKVGNCFCLRTFPPVVVAVAST